MTLSPDSRGLEALLAESGWVRALARRLCTDPASADDLVQDAWLAALERPPEHAGNVRAWLARVGQNLARARGRSESARRGRERASAQHERIESTTDVVARAEVSRRLVEHVLALDEPYRATILSRYFDALSAEEIAARDGVPASTVRTRLQRGLATLRSRLEREEGRSWLSALLPLAHGPRAGVGTTAGIGGQVTIGALAMSTIKIVVAIGGAVLLAWIAWPEPRSASHEPPAVGLVPTPEPVRSIATDAQNLDEREPRFEPSKTEEPAMAAVARTSGEAENGLEPEPTAATDVAPSTIEGIVLRGRTPVSGGRVYFWRGHWRPLPDSPERELQSGAAPALMTSDIDARGCFRITDLTADWYSLGVDLGDGVSAETFVEVSAEEPGRRVVIVLGSARIEGRVYGVEGEVLRGAVVHVSVDRNPPLFMYGVSDESGRFAIGDLPSGPHWISADRLGRKGPGASIEGMRRLQPPLGENEVRVLDVGSRMRATRWTGRLRTRGGEVVREGGSLGFTSETTGAYSEVPIESEQPFELRLAPGHWKLQVTLTTSKDGFGTGYLALGTVDVGPADFERDLEIPGTRVRGRLLGWSASPAAPRLHVSLRYPEGPFACLRAQVADDGSFHLDGVEPGVYELATHPLAISGGNPTVTVIASDVEIPIDVRVAAD